jgi:hypothetical protein
MPEQIPNLAGVATKDLVETIGAGSFKASYINWSRTMQLLRDHAPGWMTELRINENGDCLFRQPIGAVIYLRCVHIDGTTLPWVNQAIMDNRNSAIPFDKITARDVTDTERRGSCMVVAKQLGLGHELWAKMPLESGYTESHSEVSAPAPIPSSPAVKEPTREDFLEAALTKGLNTHAAEKLLGVIGDKYANGIKTLNGKDAAWVAEQNKAFESPTQDEEAKKPVPGRPKKTTKPDPSEY